MNISALNDTTVLAKRLVMGLTWKLGVWWKKWSSKRVPEDRSAGTSTQLTEVGWTQNNLDFDGNRKELISTFDSIAKLSTAPSLIKP